VLKVGIIKMLAYMGLWSVGFIAVTAVTKPTMNKVQSFVGGV